MHPQHCQPQQHQHQQQQRHQQQQQHHHHLNHHHQQQQHPQQQHPQQQQQQGTDQPLHEAALGSTYQPADVPRVLQGTQAPPASQGLTRIDDTADRSHTVQMSTPPQDLGLKTLLHSSKVQGSQLLPGQSPHSVTAANSSSSTAGEAQAVAGVHLSSEQAAAAGADVNEQHQQQAWLDSQQGQGSSQQQLALALPLCSAPSWKRVSTAPAAESQLSQALPISNKMSHAHATSAGAGHQPDTAVSNVSRSASPQEGSQHTGQQPSYSDTAAHGQKGEGLYAYLERLPNELVACRRILQYSFVLEYYMQISAEQAR